jgi:4-hydroxythreonine-4-phosphate dehydrogenase
VNSLPRIAITAGEPAGIGLDLCVKLAEYNFPAHITIIADQNALLERAKLLQQPLKISTYAAGSTANYSDKHTLNVLHSAASTIVEPKKLNPKNSQYVLNTLKIAADGCLSHHFDAMVTAPVHKGIINDAGIAFTGHTEFLADYTQTEKVVMMLVGGGIRVALATTHLPLNKVSAAITQDNLTTTIRILHHDLVHKFGILNPSIFVAGLNPHAGEDGHLGDEEINTINPTLEKLRIEGMNLIGTLPADTMFSKKNIEKADAFLAMYHDQGLPVLKYASFGEGVNITLGLPIIRTSVDHGTALEIAGTGKAEIGSLLAAIDLAIKLANKK